MVKLGPSRAEHETGGEGISAETLRRPPRHPMTQAASSAGVAIDPSRTSDAYISKYLLAAASSAAPGALV
jgi:hypothetical protein